MFMKKQSICKYIMILVDLLTFLLSLPFALFIIHKFGGDLNDYIPLTEMDERFVIHLLLSGICASWFWVRLRHYTYRKPFWFELKEIIRTVAIFSIIELAIVGFSKLYFSRYVWVLTWMIAFFLVPTGRVLVKKLLIKTKVYLKNTIIIGNSQNAIDAYNAICSESYLGLNVKYFIAAKPSPELKMLGIAVIPDSKNNIWRFFTEKTDQFIIALEDDETESRDAWLRYLTKKCYRFVSVVPALRGLPLYSTDMSFLFSHEIILLRINHNLAKRSSKILKRSMDIAVSFSLLVILFPFLLLIYLIIFVTGGQPLYGHTRVGLNGKLFKCWKFRTMKRNSEELLQQLFKKDVKAYQQWKQEYKLKNDPRITFFGAWMRKHSIDELPQLWNVLVGQMSLVGPRPITKNELEYYQENIDYYLIAKPGMTGLWQVSGRNNVDYSTRVYFDAWYVKNWSLWNDIAILCKTVPAVIRKNGAY